ncbi:MAG: hypothetical protein KBC91_04685 [Candidatus Omnitrophica bacterium]|nr:hypothetical protein [Candidatus Omnitrophota bacterium]
MNTMTASTLRSKTEISERAVQEKMDEFLDVYSFYLKTRIAWIHDEVRLKAYELQTMNSGINLRC